MPKEVLYLKLEQNAELSGESVHISDLGKLYCKTQSVQNRCRALPVFRFEEKDKGRRVVSALFVISLLQQDNPNLEVESIGASESEWNPAFLQLQAPGSRRKFRQIDQSRLPSPEPDIQKLLPHSFFPAAIPCKKSLRPETRLPDSRRAFQRQPFLRTEKFLPPYGSFLQNAAQDLPKAAP